jgi:mRNA-degrading endonuclease RelE of RelBE toxin-antitoxin system
VTYEQAQEILRSLPKKEREVIVSFAEALHKGPTERSKHGNEQRNEKCPKQKFAGGD